jgi:pimeloyl-ACP methyl ester carboxylesterase
MFKKHLSLFITIFFISSIFSASYAADGLFTAVADDGVELKLMRYRPDTSAPFRTDGQPVLLFPGIFANMNEFLSHTPKEREKDYKDMELPKAIADWAKGDPYIEKDHMRYYSLAHYLWLKGYDPWFANYRGTGRGEFKSEKGSDMTTLDVWGVLDSSACINKVIEVTGKPLVIGGHSTGGFASYAYLQGATFDIEDLKKGYAEGYLPHLRTNTELAIERNNMIKGYIAIDPGLTPWVPQEIDQEVLWKLLGQPGYLDIDSLMDNVVNPLLKTSRVTIATLDLIFGTITKLNKLYGDKLFLVPYLDFWYMENTHPYVADFYGRYAFTSTYIRALGQWGDIGLHRAIREHWKNGAENKDIVAGPEPDPGNDGYYYYDKNMYLVSVPTIAVLSESNGLVIADDVVEFLMNAKTPDPDDEWHIIPNSAHVDVPCGLNGPEITFPYIGNWLDRICAEPEPEENPIDNPVNPEADEAGSDSSDSSTFCFITTGL